MRIASIQMDRQLDVRHEMLDMYVYVRIDRHVDRQVDSRRDSNSLN